MCTWDLLTGACVYSIQAHDGALLNLAYSSNYIISMGSDERLCVWERLQGHLINSIYLVRIKNNFSHHATVMGEAQMKYLCMQHFCKTRFAQLVILYV